MHGLVLAVGQQEAFVGQSVAATYRS